MKPEFAETADIETASEDYASRFSGDVGEYFLNVQSTITLNLLQHMGDVSILDVGGGHAQLAKPLIDSGYNLTVTGSADTCRKRLDKTCEQGCFSYVTCDSLNLPYEDNAFDVVMSFRLLPHAVHWQKLLAEMCRVAKRSVIFDYPDRRSANILYDLLFDLKKNIEGNTRTFLLFSRGDITRELNANGFGSPLFRPEFFVPMVIHRKLNKAPISRAMELFSQKTGLTYLFGSPIIVRSDKIAQQQRRD